MRSRASGATCFHASFGCFCIRALALSEPKLFPISFRLFYLCTLLERAAPDRAGARTYQLTELSANHNLLSERPALPILRRRGVL